MLDFQSAPKTKKSCIWPSSEHLWQIWLISVQRFQRRRFKCEKLTDGRTDAYQWQKLTWPMARWAKKNMHKFHTLQCKNDKLLLSNHHLLWCNIYALWGRHPVSVMVKTLFLKYISCCCSTSSLGNMPPATTHLKTFRPGQPYRLSACHLSMQHNHGLTRTVLCL